MTGLPTSSDTPACQDPKYDKWFAIGFRSDLRRWKGPEDLRKADWASWLASVPKWARRNGVEKVRRLIEDRDWETMRTYARGRPDEDIIMWYLVQSENHDSFVVEFDLPYDFALGTQVRAVWKVDAGDVSAINALVPEVYCLKRPNGGRLCSLLVWVKMVCLGKLR